MLQQFEVGTLICKCSFYGLTAWLIKFDFRREDLNFVKIRTVTKGLIVQI